VTSWDMSRWLGLAAMVGGLLWAAQNVLVLTVEQIRWTEGVFLVALLLVLAGVFGFHFLQADRYGPIGRAGLWTIFGATLVQEIGLLIFILGDATLFWVVPRVGYIAMIVGYVLFGAATLQARVVPRWCGLALLLGEPGRADNEQVRTRGLRGDSVRAYVGGSGVRAVVVEGRLGRPTGPSRWVKA
jgi:hypothetical protein